jgi:hypothetical protein
MLQQPNWHITSDRQVLEISLDLPNRTVVSTMLAGEDNFQHPRIIQARQLALSKA